MTKNDFLRKNTAVILVDMQDFFLDNFVKENKNQLISNQLEIIKSCVKNKLPFIILEYKCRGILRGKLIGSLDQIINNTYRETIIKESNSGFTKTNLNSILIKLKIKQVLIMGINAHGCVQDTAIGALKRGYKVITAHGLIASSSRKNLDFSAKNKKWYQKNTIFLNDIKDLIS